MSQPDRRSLLIGACRKRQDQIRHKLAQVRQRLQITDGLDNERWAQVERDLLARYDQEEERVQRLINESQESLLAVPSRETPVSVETSGERPEPGRAQILALQQNYKRAQLLVAQKNEQITRLQKELESKPGPAGLESELLVKDQTIAKLRQQNQSLSEQVAKLKSESPDEEELDELHRQNQALSNALAEREQSAAAAQRKGDAEIEELHRQNALLSNELADRDQSESELRAEIQRLQEAPPANEQELEDLQRQNEYLNQELSLRDQSEAHLRSEVGRLQSDYENRIVELGHQTESLRADLDLKSEVVGRIQFDLELKTGDFDRLSREHAQLLESSQQPSRESAHQQELLEQLTEQAEKHEQELAYQLAQQAEQSTEQLAELQRQLEEALTAPSSVEADLRAQIAELQQSAGPSPAEEELRAQVAELQQKLDQPAGPSPAEGELRAQIAELQQKLDQPAEDTEKAQLQAEVEQLRQQVRQSQALVPPEDTEKLRLQEQLAEAQQEARALGEKLTLQADKFQLELELLKSAQKLVASELSKLHEAPLGATPPVNKSGYLGGDPLPEETGRLGAAPAARTGGFLGTPTPAKGAYLGDPAADETGLLGGPPSRPIPSRPPAPVSTGPAKPAPAGWLGSPDEEPWDGYVRPNYSKAGLPPGAAGAAKLAARSANLGATSSSEAPLDLEATVEGTSDWLDDPATSETEELPDWLTAEKPTD